MIYCLETHSLTTGMITKLERWTTRLLRQIARIPTYMIHVSNNTLRKKYKKITIGSIMKRRRLLFWKKMLRPWIVDDGRHDTSLKSRLLCLGRSSFEDESDEPRQTVLMEQLSKDLILLRKVLKDCADADPNTERLLQSTDPGDAELTVCKAPAEQITERPSDEWLRRLSSLNDSVISTIPTWDGKRFDENTQRICSTCDCTCSGKRGLSIHMIQWRGTDNHQSQPIKTTEWTAYTDNSFERQSWSVKKAKAFQLDLPMCLFHQHPWTQWWSDHKHQSYHQLPHPRQHNEHRQKSHSWQRLINHVIRSRLDSFSHQIDKNEKRWAMFGPIPESNTPMIVTAKEVNKKRKDMKSPTDEEKVSERDSMLVMDLTRLVLQYESERRVHVRDDNVDFSMSSSDKLTKESQWTTDKYARQTLSSRRNKTRTTRTISATRSQTRC